MSDAADELDGRDRLGDEAGQRLILAARRNRAAEAASLIDDEGVDPDHRGHGGCTAVYHASLKGHLGVLQALLSRGANPNIAASWGTTPMMMASHLDTLALVQLLAIYGADMAVTNRGSTAQQEALRFNRPTNALFLKAIKNMHPFQIAIACRFPATALRRMLRHGTLDPAGCGPVSALVATATSTAELWPGQPTPYSAPDTTELTVLMRDAIGIWSPSTHWLHHEWVREAVRTVLLAVGRLNRATDGTDGHPTMPSELWLVVLGMLSRCDW